MSFWSKLFGSPLSKTTTALTEEDESSYSELVRNGDLNGIKALLKSTPALISSKDNLGNTKLHFAAGCGQTELAKLLLANGAAVNSTDNHGSTPLHYAAMLGGNEVAKLLLARKANVNARTNDLGWTPLHCAANWGRKEAAELLLANKADVNAKDNNYETPLFYALRRGHNGVPELLLRHGGHE